MLQYGWTVALFLAAIAIAGPGADAKETVTDVAPAWAGHPVGFALLTHGDWQFVAFYDAKRKLTVGSRKLSETSWHFVKLPETVGWDSHNYITMAVDDDGCIHLCANMHVNPLVYFRTSKPDDIDTFERVPSMVGRNEDKCTYPSFFRGPNKEFIFTYRYGSSGNGDQYYNVYDCKTRAWKPLMDGPLTSGEGQMNAYFGGLRLGPDGYYHLAWIWRDTGDCTTNHDISYARSRDLVHWETSGGKPLKLPMTLKTCEIVDPVPVKAGAINTSVALSFDSHRRPVISYIKYDEKGLTQAYVARVEDGKWKIRQVSEWDYRWAFSGYGSIQGEVHVGGVSPVDDGKLALPYTHIKYGGGKLILDEATLKLIEDSRTASAAITGDVKPAQEAKPKLESRTCGDSGSSTEPGVRYMLRWETYGIHRDKAWEGEPPPPCMLKLVKVEP